jgi:hypothetical protein
VLLGIFASNANLPEPDLANRAASSAAKQVRVVGSGNGA